MKFIALIMYAAFALSTSPWTTDFAAAKKTAQQKHQCILLTFSGSDWCGPCIRLHKEVFESIDFTSFAQDNLVLVNADFPRLKKNQLPKEQQQQNDKLADEYNRAGNFPSTVLLNEEGKQLKVWDGFPKEGSAAFIDELKQASHVNR